MDISFRSCMTAGVATITAAAVAFGPAVEEPRHAAPPTAVVQVAPTPIKLAAQVQPLAVTEVPNLLVGWLERFIVPPSAGQPFPTPPSGPTAAPTSVPDTLEWAYHAVEPWVRYGFEVATYAVGWVPYVGWLSGQIMIFYNFGERIVHAIVHNTLDWLNGNGSFIQNVGEGIAWSIDALIQLGIDEWNYFLPPLPPLPPFPFAATAATTTTQDLTTLAASDTSQGIEKHGAFKGEDVADVPGEATVTETKEPKTPKAPKEPKSAIEVAAQTEDSTESNDDSTDAKKPPANEKKPADKGPKAGTDSSTSPKDNDTKGGKKDDTSKKDSE